MSSNRSCVSCVGKSQAAKAVQCSLEYTTLRKVTQATEIYYDPDPMVEPPSLLAALTSHWHLVAVPIGK